MDERTLRYYASEAPEIAERYDAGKQEMRKLLQRAFSEGMRVLDIGAGSGRDVELLLEMGCDAYGVEPCDELRTTAIERHPRLRARIEKGELPGLGLPFGGNFDGVLCSAVLMHLPRAEILDAAIAMRDVLRENGRLLLSTPLERHGLDEENRDSNGRLFTPLPPDHVQLLFERIGFVLLERWISGDSLGRKEQAWCNFLFIAQHPGGSRPVDLIEGILSRDKKTATYKLALFRALSEIAISEFGQARWVADGVVGIPVAVVSEKWLNYYWPLFESIRFVPQIRGESPICRMPIAFRSSLSELIRHYTRRGGFTSFVLDFRGDRLTEDVKGLLARVLNQMQNTIVKGPVTYSGGSLESGRVFSYDQRTQEIRMSTALWRELSLIGYWVQDAIILRWAELTSEISRKAFRPSEVIDLLLTVPIPERDTTEAREAYRKAGALECTWSGAPIQQSFQVDHIIPFSLWHNNDLWNLVPASPAVNAEKRDKLPTRKLMLSRRESIINYWEILRSANVARFDHEARRIAGVNDLTSGWQMPIFQAVSDAVEFTATQRGCERWEPRS